jgi:hypothetical protein
MLNHRTVLVAALGVMLGALPTRTARAQFSTEWWGRPSVELSYTQLRMDSDGPSLDANGVGGRVMWHVAPQGADTARGSAALPRLSLGLYGSYAPEHDYAGGLSFGVGTIGGVADVRPFVTPLGGRVDPFVSLGAGWLNTRVDAAVAPPPSPLFNKSHIAFALTPGVGARVLLTPRLALQADVHDAATFLGDTRQNVGFGVGLRLLP